MKMGRIWGDRGLRVSLITAQPYLIYSGTLPQCMGGFIEPKESRINLEELCRRYGTRFQQGVVNHIDQAAKQVSNSEGHIYEYDYLVINTGVKTTPVFDSDLVTPVKPLERLLNLRQQLISGSIRKLLIAGGGAAGTELALNMSHPGNALPTRPEITLIEKNSRILSSFPLKASGIATRWLHEQGVDVQTGRAADPSRFDEYDAVINAAGNHAATSSITHPFPVSEGGRILGEESLQITDYHKHFAAGDTFNIRGSEYSPVGVHAVKQGVTLRENIQRLIDGKPLRAYKPYPITPLILSNGPDRAIWISGRFVTAGSIPAILKTVVDHRWLDRYSRLRPERRSLLNLIQFAHHRAVMATRN